MGSLFRSEKMSLCQLFISPEAAYSSLAILGEKAIVQFRDLNAAVNQFQRKFVGDVRRCHEIERQIRLIEEELVKESIPMPDVTELPTAPNPKEVTHLEALIEKKEYEIRMLNENYENLQRNYFELIELKHVLEDTDAVLSQHEFGSYALSRAVMGGTSLPLGRLGFLAGVIAQRKMMAFETMLWRLSRGNLLVRQIPIKEPLLDPTTKSKINKSAFVVFIQGEELLHRVQKICAGFRASIYPCPSTFEERAHILQSVRVKLEDVKLILNQTNDHRQKVLSELAKELPIWIIKIRKMKTVYHGLNMFNVDVTTRCLIGECWIPTRDIKIVDEVLRLSARLSGSSIPSFISEIEMMEDPPTFNRTNKFTHGFQLLINSYGVPSYREVNPALYTIITFPFLFAVMFGDAGHGLILALFALSMVLTEKKTSKNKKIGEVHKIFFGGRYIILLMGCFSVYTGLLYNDVFSKSLNIFGSSWRVTANESTLLKNKDLQLDPGVDDYIGTPYPFGIDPVWQLASANKIVFMNSFKMKLSIIFGVLHMIFGLSLCIFNDIYFKRLSGIFLVFLPQLLFLVLLFFYLVTLIFVKWIMFTAKNDEHPELGSSCANSVLLLFINMMLQQSTVVKDDCKEFFFKGQEEMQLLFVLTAILCIPVMLFGAPLYEHMKKLKRNKYRPIKHAAHNESYEINQSTELQNSDKVSNESNVRRNVHSQQDSHSMGDLLIHQGIHTIEYVLSTISHTASYLRLWALSLAHAQLSEVLWSLVFATGLRYHGYVGAIAIFLLFAAWSSLTVSILIMMEGLSAFLHTLRLHWVEFMSKFYGGHGYIFEPFSFATTLVADGDTKVA